MKPRKKLERQRRLNLICPILIAVEHGNSLKFLEKNIETKTWRKSQDNLASAVMQCSESSTHEAPLPVLPLILVWRLALLRREFGRDRDRDRGVNNCSDVYETSGSSVPHPL